MYLPIADSRLVAPKGLGTFTGGSVQDILPTGRRIELRLGAAEGEPCLAFQHTAWRRRAPGRLAPAG